MKIDTRELIFYMGLSRGSVVSVVGSGGKTTFIETLAKTLAQRSRVCVAASTKMRCPKEEDGVTVILKDSPKMRESIVQPGMYYMADECLPGGKLHGFSSEMMAWAKENTDIILIEADGSRQRPLKGWADYEPVIPEETMLTVGIMPVYVLGKMVDDTIVHRLPYFTEITGAKAGDVITKEHLIRAIIHPKGLFGKAKGEKMLFFSQVDDDTSEALANEIAEDERLNFIEKIIIGCMV